MDVARAWAAPVDDTGDEAMTAALRDYGADEATIEEWTEPPPPEVVEVLTENWDAVRVFYALSSQWNHAGFGRPVGLNYQAIEPTARMMGIDMTPEIFSGLQVMENEALRAIDERLQRG